MTAKGIYDSVIHDECLQSRLLKSCPNPGGFIIKDSFSNNYAENMSFAPPPRAKGPKSYYAQNECQPAYNKL